MLHFPFMPRAPSTRRVSCPGAFGSPRRAGAQESYRHRRLASHAALDRPPHRARFPHLMIPRYPYDSHPPVGIHGFPIPPLIAIPHWPARVTGKCHRSPLHDSGLSQAFTSRTGYEQDTSLPSHAHRIASHLIHPAHDSSHARMLTWLASIYLHHLRTHFFTTLASLYRRTRCPHALYSFSHTLLADEKSGHTHAHMSLSAVLAFGCTERSGWEQSCCRCI